MHTLGDIATLIGVPIDRQSAARVVTGVASLVEAGPTELAYLGSDAYVRQFRATRAGVVIVDRKIRLPQQLSTLTLPVDDAEEAFSKVLTLFAPQDNANRPTFLVTHRSVGKARSHSGHRPIGRDW